MSPTPYDRVLRDLSEEVASRLGCRLGHVEYDRRLEMHRIVMWRGERSFLILLSQRVVRGADAERLRRYIRDAAEAFTGARAVSRDT